MSLESLEVADLSSGVLGYFLSKNDLINHKSPIARTAYSYSPLTDTPLQPEQ